MVSLGSAKVGERTAPKVWMGELGAPKPLWVGVVASKALEGRIRRPKDDLSRTCDLLLGTQGIDSRRISRKLAEGGNRAGMAGVLTTSKW